MRACQHRGRASADGTSDLRWRRHRGCEDVQSQRCVRARRGELDSRGPRVTIGVFGLRREEDPRRADGALQVCSPGGLCGRQRLQRCPNLRRFQKSVLCRVVPENVAFQRVRASMCRSVWLRLGVGRSLDASAVPSAMRMTRAAVHPRARHTSRTGTRPADARGNEQPAARGRAQAPPLPLLGQVCCG